MRLAESVYQFFDRHCRGRFDMSLVPPEPGWAEVDANEMPKSDMLPYVAHYDDESLLTKDDGLIQVIELDGLYFESLTRKQIRRFERDRNTVLREAAASNRGVYVHVVRRQVELYPAGQGYTWFWKVFNAAWRERVTARRMFANKIYITVVENQFRQDAPGVIDRVVSLVKNRKGTQQRERVLEKLHQRLNGAANSIVKGLSDYGARKLRIQRWPALGADWVPAEEARAAVARFKLSWDSFVRQFGQQGVYGSGDLLDYLGPEYSEITGFLSYLVNLQDARQPVTDLPLDKSLAQSWVDCKTLGNMMCVENTQGSRAAAVLSMAEWPPHTSSRMLDDFLKKPVEFIVTQSFFYTDRISAEHELRLARRRMTVNDKEGVAEDDSQEIVQGLKALTRGQAVNGKHHLSILVHVPVATSGRDRAENRSLTVEALDAAVEEVASAFTPMGVKSVREWYAMETFYWSQLPGQGQHFIGRRGRIKSSNFAGFASLHNYAVGKLEGNLWGPAIIVLETESGTPYCFNFHREQEGVVAGHLAVAASTGAGKTAFVAALIAMADKACPRVFWFDNREGAAIFMRAMGGTHVTLTALGTTGWNPFRLADTLENRAYQLDLLVMMRTCYGGTCSADDMERFKKAIDENYKLADKDRRLRNVAWCFGHGELGKVMRPWHGANGEIGANAGVFDNEDDNIDLESCRYHCFEMRQLIKDGVARPELPVVLSYPFHRIEQAMTGEPFIVVLDEGQNLVKHAYWREKIDAYFNQIRRKNGVMVFITPDVKYFYCETDSILKQAVTKVYLSNSEGQQEEFVHTGLTAQEFEFLRDTPATARKLLIRRGQESIRVRFDLSDHPATRRFISVLSANEKAVALMHRVIEDLGSNEPEVWVPVFMERALAQDTHNLQPKGA